MAAQALDSVVGWQRRDVECEATEFMAFIDARRSKEISRTRAYIVAIGTSASVGARIFVGSVAPLLGAECTSGFGPQHDLEAISMRRHRRPAFGLQFKRRRPLQTLADNMVEVMLAEGVAAIHQLAFVGEGWRRLNRICAT